MGKFEKKQPTADESAQDLSVSTLTEQPKGIPTVEQYLSQFRASDEDYVTTSLRFKEGFDPKPWNFHGFRHDAVAKWSRLIKKDGWVQIKKDSGIFGQSFIDWFEEDAWDEDDCITDNPLLDRSTGKSFKEIVWFVRPVAAGKARQMLEAARSGEYVNNKNAEKSRGQWAGEKAGMVKIDEYEIGDDGNGW